EGKLSPIALVRRLSAGRKAVRKIREAPVFSAVRMASNTILCARSASIPAKTALNIRGYTDGEWPARRATNRLVITGRQPQPLTGFKTVQTSCHMLRGIDALRVT